MSDIDNSVDQIEAVAANGLLHRRAFLKTGALITGGASFLSAKAAPQRSMYGVLCQAGSLKLMAIALNMNLMWFACLVLALRLWEPGPLERHTVAWNE